MLEPWIGLRGSGAGWPLRRMRSQRLRNCRGPNYQEAKQHLNGKLLRGKVRELQPSLRPKRHGKLPLHRMPFLKGRQQVEGRLFLKSKADRKRELQLWNNQRLQGQLYLRRLQLEGKQPHKKLQLEDGPHPHGQPQRKLLEGGLHSHGRALPKRKLWLEGKPRPPKKARKLQPEGKMCQHGRLPLKWQLLGELPWYKKLRPKRKLQLDNTLHSQGRPPKVRLDSKLGLQTQGHLSKLPGSLQHHCKPHLKLRLDFNRTRKLLRRLEGEQKQNLPNLKGVEPWG